VAGLPFGRLADKLSRKRLLAIGVSVWAALTALGGLASSYGMLLVTRLGVGIGEATCAPAATSWIGDLVPAGRRARAMAIFMMAVPVGGFLSFAVGGPVAQAWGWRMALVLAAIPAVALVPALLALIAPRPVLVQNNVNDSWFPVAGYVKVKAELEAVYAALGAAERFEAHISSTAHDLTPEFTERIVAWLERFM